MFKISLVHLNSSQFTLSHVLFPRVVLFIYRDYTSAAAWDNTCYSDWYSFVSLIWNEKFQTQGCWICTSTLQDTKLQEQRLAKLYSIRTHILHTCRLYCTTCYQFIRYTSTLCYVPSFFCTNVNCIVSAVTEVLPSVLTELASWDWWQKQHTFMRLRLECRTWGQLYNPVTEQIQHIQLTVCMT